MTGHRSTAGEAPSRAGDARAAAEMATAAGELLVRLRSGRSTGDALKDAGDTASQEHLAAELARRFPDDAVLSEEAADDERRVAATGCGSSIRSTAPGSSPSLPATTGRCTSPWSSTAAGGRSGGAARPPASLSTRAPRRRPGRATIGPPRLVVSRTRPTEHAQHLARTLGAELVPMGSAGAKAMAVVLGDADVYAHSGGQYEWDSAAPVAVAAAAGLHVSRLDGSPLRYNQPDPWLPDLLICRPELADAVIRTCREVDS